MSIDSIFQSFPQLETQRLVMPDNIASIRLLEKIGFKNEGLLIGYENWGSKGFTDLYILSLLRTYAHL
jgi:RimJ/RimL family protein N-acetyltransferase